MLRPYTPNRKESRSADPRSVRGGVSSFAVMRTPAADNNPASKAPKSGSGGRFSELGAGHWDSSCRSCVTIFFIDSPAPVFHHAGTAKRESDKGSDVAIMSNTSVAVPASSVTMLLKYPSSIGSCFGSRGADGNDKPWDALCRLSWCEAYQSVTAPLFRYFNFTITGAEHSNPSFIFSHYRPYCFRTVFLRYILYFHNNSRYLLKAMPKLYTDLHHHCHYHRLTYSALSF